MRRFLLLLVPLAPCILSAQSAQPPVIDVHLHAPLSPGPVDGFAGLFERYAAEMDSLNVRMAVLNGAPDVLYDWKARAPQRMIPALLAVSHSSTVLGIMLVGTITYAHAQWLNYPDGRTPRTKDGKPNLTAPAPRLNGKLDISGVWQAERSPESEYDSVLGQGFTALQPDTHERIVEIRGLCYLDARATAGWNVA